MKNLFAFYLALLTPLLMLVGVFQYRLLLQDIPGRAEITGKRINKKRRPVEGYFPRASRKIFQGTLPG